MCIKGMMMFSTVVILSALTATGCSRSSDIDVVKERDGSGMIHGTQLRTIMMKLNNAMYDPHLNEHEREEEKRQQALNFADNIDAIADSIELIPKWSEKVHLDAEQMERYRSYVEDMKRKSHEIRRVADAGEMDKLRPALNDMVVTCNQCHDYFRDAQ